MVQFLPKTQNFIKNIVFDDCAEPWFVYVETFFPAFIKFFLTVHFIDLEDIVRGRGEMAVREGGDGRRRRGRHLKKPTARERATPVQRWSQQGLKTLLIITRPIEFIGLHWLLYAAAEQFFYDWQTLIERVGECSNPPSLGPFHRSTVSGSSVVAPAGVAVSLPILDQNRGAWANNAFNVVVPVGAYQAFFALTIKRSILPLSAVFVQLTVPSFTGFQVIKGDPVPIGVGETVDLVVSASWGSPLLWGGGAVSWQIAGTASATGVDILGGRVIVTRSG